MTLSSGRFTRARAQIVPLFALGLLGFTALIGLVLDGGTLYVQRRTAQNAADAGALAGSRALQKSSTSPSSTLQTELCKYVLANNFGVTPSVTAYFVKVDGTAATNGGILASSNCTTGLGSTTIPTSPDQVAGIHVDVTFSYTPYLAKIIGITNFSPVGSAVGQVWGYSISAALLAPWAICGPTAPVDDTGTLAPILDSTTTPPTILASAIAAHTPVILESSKLAGWTGGAPQCPNSTGNDWKGQGAETGLVTVPLTLDIVSGNGSISAQCSLTGQVDPSGPGQCYLFVPVSDANNTVNTAHVVTFACLDIYPGTNGNYKWIGTVQDNSKCLVLPYKPVWTWSTGTTGSSSIVALTK